MRCQVNGKTRSFPKHPCGIFFALTSCSVFLPMVGLCFLGLARFCILILTEDVETVVAKLQHARFRLPLLGKLHDAPLAVSLILQFHFTCMHSTATFSRCKVPISCPWCRTLGCGLGFYLQRSNWLATCFVLSRTCMTG